jgi:hypothetical protein
VLRISDFSIETVAESLTVIHREASGTIGTTGVAGMTVGPHFDLRIRVTYISV